MKDWMVIDRRDFIKLGAGIGALTTTAMNAEVVSAQDANAQLGSIDCHVHWTPEAYTRAIAQLEVPAGATAHDEPGGPNPLSYDLEKRIAWMNERGVQIHVLTMGGDMPWQWVSNDAGAHLAQILNDAAIEAHLKYPSRFLAGIEMDVRDPAGALKELNRVAGKPGMRAVHLPNSIENVDYLFDPAYEPLLARSEELGYPLLFHPLDGEDNIYGGKERLGSPLDTSANINNTLGFTFEHATTVAKFIISGTLDKFPKLEVILPHSGGCFPYIAGRIERGFAAKKFQAARPFREYIRRFHYDTLAFYPETLRFLIELVGADRVVIGTDNYAPMDVQQPNALVEQINLAAKDRDLILRGNAARLLGV